MSEFIDYVFQRSTSLNKIDNSLYSKYNVKNGLRNEDGTGSCWTYKNIRCCGI